MSKEYDRYLTRDFLKAACEHLKLADFKRPALRDVSGAKLLLRALEESMYRPDKK